MILRCYQGLEEKMKNRGVNCSSFVFLFVMGMGIIWLVVTIQNMQAASDSGNWLSTKGVIEETWVEREEQTDADGEIEDYFKPYVRYSYTVNESEYSSERIDFGSQRSHNTRSGADNFLTRYPVGAEVDVYYDPAEPWEAVLVREASGATWGLIGGGAMVLFSIIGWIGVWIKGRRSFAGTTEEDADQK
jgi:hypothetical protein